MATIPTKLLRHAALAAAVVAVGGLTAGRAEAQPYGGPRGPVTSPYLNLLRGNSPDYLNYYGLVRPEQQNRSLSNQVQQQQLQVGTLSNSVSGLQQQAQNAGSFATGHAFGFQTHRKYFMTTTGAGVPGLAGGSTGGRGPMFGGSGNALRGAGAPPAGANGLPTGVGRGRGQ